MSDGKNIGKVVQVIGPTVDVAFDPQNLPKILNAIKIEDKEKGLDLTMEAALHVGDNMVRCIAMSSTDGLVRGMPAVDTGEPDHGAGRRAVPWAHLQPHRARRSTARARSRPTRSIRSTVLHLRSRIRRPPPRCSRRASRSSTCSLRTGAAARSACSAAPAWARRFSFRSSFATSPPSTAAIRCSPVWASERARATTSTSK